MLPKCRRVVEEEPKPRHIVPRERLGSGATDADRFNESKSAAAAFFFGLRTD